MSNAKSFFEIPLRKVFKAFKDPVIINNLHKNKSDVQG